jgi:hypothetical protein
MNLSTHTPLRSTLKEAPRMKSSAYIIVFLLLVSTCAAFAQMNVRIIPNRPYHDSGSPLSIELKIDNTGSPQNVDLYFVLELAGTYFFYPSFSSDLSLIDHQSITIPTTTGSSFTISIIPEFVLPDQLPCCLRRRTLYA